MKKYGMMFLALVVMASVAVAGDYTEIKAARSLPKTTPWDLKELSAPPDFEWGKGDTYKELYYEGEMFKGKKTRVFAYYATPGTMAGDPSKDKDLPGIVLVHGGGGRAFEKWVQLWARRGYAAIAMDMGGRGAKGKKLQAGGPDQDDGVKFGNIDDPITDQWTYHSVANVIRAHSLLRSFPEVSPKRTAITGISWGGYLTCIVAGLDNRFRVAVPVYGCGFLDENSIWLQEFEKLGPERTKKWVTLWDPSKYVGSASMPMLFANGGKDFAYPPDSHAKTYALVKSKKNLHYVPFLRHGHHFDRPKAVEVFINHHLVGGKDLAKITSVKIGKGKITAKVTSKTKLTTAELHYSLEPFPGDQKKREWHKKPAVIEKNKKIISELPPKDTQAWFITVTDQRKTTVSSELTFPKK